MIHELLKLAGGVVAVVQSQMDFSPFVNSAGRVKLPSRDLRLEIEKRSEGDS